MFLNSVQVPCPRSTMSTFNEYSCCLTGGNSLLNSDVQTFSTISGKLQSKHKTFVLTFMATKNDFISIATNRHFGGSLLIPN